jgi:hypothetical protein
LIMERLEGMRNRCDTLYFQHLLNFYFHTDRSVEP